MKSMVLGLLVEIKYENEKMERATRTIICCMCVDALKIGVSDVITPEYYSNHLERSKKEDSRYYKNPKED
jgi:hypothetical protein